MLEPHHCKPPAGVAVRKRCRYPVLPIKSLGLAGRLCLASPSVPRVSTAPGNTNKGTQLSEFSPSSTSAPAPHGNRLLPEQLPLAQKQRSRMSLGVWWKPQDPSTKKTEREGRKAHWRCEGFPDLQVKDPGIYKAERGRMGLKEKGSTDRKRERTDRGS